MALPEVYGSDCDVYGPGNFEVSCQGSIVDIVATVLQKLEFGGCTDFSRPPSLSPATSADLDLDAEAGSDFEGTENPQTFSEDFPRLQAELCELEAHGMSCSIDGVLGDAALVSLSIPLPETISKSTAEAWGFARDRPLRLSFAINEAHFLRSAAQRLEISFWQEKTTAGFVPLDAGVQLSNMIKIFWRHFCNAPVTESPCDGIAVAPPHLLAKKLSIINDAVAQAGVLLPLARYLTNRVPCLHEYCVICDEPLVFPSLLRPTVCTRTLCCYSARTFGAAVTGEFSSQNASLEVWDLLVVMAICAGRMDQTRMRLLFTEQNFPALFSPGSAEPAFMATDAGFKRLRDLLGKLGEYRLRQVSSYGISWLNQIFSEQDRSKKIDPLLPALLGWIWDSNRSYILALQDEDRIEALSTPFQYLLLSAPPEMETAFQALKIKYGAEFCFHGSSSGNWHCILRQGLRNASGTKLMTAGQAYGPGIYLGRDSATSAGFSGGLAGRATQRGKAHPDADFETTGRRLHDPESLVMLAICEVAQVPSLKKHGLIWVCPEEAAVVTRFLMVYRGKEVPAVNLSVPSVSSQLWELTRRWTQ